MPGRLTSALVILGLIASGLNAQEAGLSALQRAALHDDVLLARNLLDAGADVDERNRYGITPLWLAATNGSADFIELLVEHGADVSSLMEHGETALMAAARTGNVTAISKLLDAGSDPNVQESLLGETALMWAAGENHADAVRALVAGGADPDMASRSLDLAPMNWVQIGMVSTVLPVGGWTALMIAARQNAQSAAIALIEEGADANARDPDGSTALHIAIMNRHFDLAVMLLEAGADPNVTDRSGASALYAAVDMVTLGNDIGRPAMPLYDAHGAIDVVRIALAHGADANLPLSTPTIARHHGFPDRSLGTGATALMRAAKGGDLESARLLIDAGANVNATQDDGSTAVHMAARNQEGAFIEWLASHGAPLDVSDAEGRTALDLVLQPGRFNNEETAALLMRLLQ